MVHPPLKYVWGTVWTYRHVEEKGHPHHGSILFRVKLAGEWPKAMQEPFLKKINLSGNAAAGYSLPSDEENGIITIPLTHLLIKELGNRIPKPGEAVLGTLIGRRVQLWSLEPTEPRFKLLDDEEVPRGRQFDPWKTLTWLKHEDGKVMYTSSRDGSGSQWCDSRLLYELDQTNSAIRNEDTAFSERAKQARR